MVAHHDHDDDDQQDHELEGQEGRRRRARAGKGTPTSANPTFSFALPGAAPIGVPNFFIDSFRIPPFLLPIYQAAGIQYDVPWQVLAAINEIETDYGRNLSVSSAGAVGWMQFLPSTWKSWGIDANGDKIADPYNPVDAIFSAARYLQAAGASKDLNQSIFAYNHASWYVQSVLLRAKLIGGMPDQLIGALTGLVEGHFPVAAPAKYADNAVTELAKTRVKSANAAIAIGSDASRAVSIYAKQNAPVIAVNDGRIVKVGQNAAWGRYIQLQDQTGNIYTYAQLGQVPTQYPVPKPVKMTAKQLAEELATPALPVAEAAPAPAPASTDRDGHRAQTEASTSKPPPTADHAAARSKPAARDAAPTAQPSVVAPMVKERLFANPSRPASFAAGGKLQLHPSAPGARSRVSATTSLMSCISGRTSTRSSRCGPVRSSLPARSSGGSRRGPASLPRMCSSWSSRRVRTRRRSIPSRSSTGGSCSRRPRCIAPRVWTRSSVLARRTPRSARSC